MSNDKPPIKDRLVQITIAEYCQMGKGGLEMPHTYTVKGGGVWCDADELRKWRSQNTSGTESGTPRGEAGDRAGPPVSPPNPEAKP